MEIKVAKSAGFCFGVRKAVDTVFEQVEAPHDNPIYTYGPIIHNQVVTDELATKGVRVIHNKEELSQLHDGILIIRSHGVARDVYTLAEARGLKVVDATCPFVKKIHDIVLEESERGRHILIVGDPGHPEVQGIVGWALGKVDVIQSIDDFDQLNIGKDEKLSLVAQTTFHYEKFQEIVAKIDQREYTINVFNTICNATKTRQEEAREIAESVDAMIVIGDKHSSNTQKLYEICKHACETTIFVQTVDDLDFRQLVSDKTVGITAGASTPNTIIEEVQSQCQNKLLNKC